MRTKGPQGSSWERSQLQRAAWDADEAPARAGWRQSCRTPGPQGAASPPKQAPGELSACSVARELPFLPLSAMSSSGGGVTCEDPGTKPASPAAVESTFVLPMQRGKARPRSRQSNFLRSSGPGRLGPGRLGPGRLGLQCSCVLGHLPCRQPLMGPKGPCKVGHSLVVVVFHKLLELLDVAHGLQVLLHVGQGGEVICRT